LLFSVMWPCNPSGRQHSTNNKKNYDCISVLCALANKRRDSLFRSVCLNKKHRLYGRSCD